MENLSARSSDTHVHAQKNSYKPLCGNSKKFNVQPKWFRNGKFLSQAPCHVRATTVPVCDTTAPLDGTTHSYQVQHVSHALPCTNSVRTALAHVQATYGEARNMKTHVSTYCAYNNSNNCRIYSAFWAHIYFAQYS